MAGFPKEAGTSDIGHVRQRLAGPVSLSSSDNYNKGPGRFLNLRQKLHLAGYAANVTKIITHSSLQTEHAE